MCSLMDRGRVGIYNNGESIRVRLVVYIAQHIGQNP